MIKYYLSREIYICHVHIIKYFQKIYYLFDILICIHQFYPKILKLLLTLYLNLNSYLIIIIIIIKNLNFYQLQNNYYFYKK